MCKVKSEKDETGWDLCVYLCTVANESGGYSNCAGNTKFLHHENAKSTKKSVQLKLAAFISVNPPSSLHCFVVLGTVVSSFYLWIIEVRQLEENPFFALLFHGLLFRQCNLNSQVTDEKKNQFILPNIIEFEINKLNCLNQRSEQASRLKQKLGHM